jgi:hypothetical protein
MHEIEVVFVEVFIFSQHSTDELLDCVRFIPLIALRASRSWLYAPMFSVFRIRAAIVRPKTYKPRNS